MYEYSTVLIFTRAQPSHKAGWYSIIIHSTYDFSHLDSRPDPRETQDPRRRTEIIPVKRFPHQNEIADFGQWPRPLHNR
jgi:hypothetical protein